MSKSGNPLVKINIFQRFKYQKNRAVSTVLSVLETLKNIEFPLLKMKPKRGSGCKWGNPQEKKLNA